MLSYGEVIFTVAAAVALFGNAGSQFSSQCAGPKDIPVLARGAGRFVGKAVGYIQSARGQLDDVMKRSQVDHVHKELQETMAQLEAIRYEILSGMSISNPGPITRRVLNLDGKADPPGASTSTQTETVVVGAKDTPNLENGAHTPLSETLKASNTKELHRGSSQSHVEAGGFTVSTSTTTAVPLAFRPGPDGTFNTMPASTGRIAARRVVAKPIGVAPAASPQHLSPTKAEVLQNVTVLPISAVSAGLLPQRTGPSPEGSDLVLESVTERKVAFDTLEFFQQPDLMARKS